MNFHILAKKNLGPGVAYNKFTTVGAALCFFPLLGSPFLLRLLLFKLPRDGRADGTTAAITFVFDDRPTRGPLPSSLLGFPLSLVLPSRRAINL